MLNKCNTCVFVWEKCKLNYNEMSKDLKELYIIKDVALNKKGITEKTNKRI